VSAVRLQLGHPFRHEGRALDNVEAELPGELDELVLVTAHLDSTAAFSAGYDPVRDPAPGADDDASGTVGVLAIGPHDPALLAVATLSLALVLFLDAVDLDVPEIRRDWHVPVLSLGPGTLLTIGGVAFAGNRGIKRVEVSTDGGKTWNTLPGRATTTNNPNGANYGDAYTCKSGTGCGSDSGAAQWIEEQMDLSAYAGRKILLRFEYVTDAEVTRAGFVVDDISIPEIHYADDAEQDANGWQADGFARTDNVLPQRYLVQAIEFGSPTRVTSVALDQNNHGTFTTSGLGREVSRVVIVVSGDTPVTWETASYSYKIE